MQVLQWVGNHGSRSMLEIKLRWQRLHIRDGDHRDWGSTDVCACRDLLIAHLRFMHTIPYNLRGSDEKNNNPILYRPCLLLMHAYTVSEVACFSTSVPLEVSVLHYSILWTSTMTGLEHLQIFVLFLSNVWLKLRCFFLLELKMVIDSLFCKLFSSLTSVHFIDMFSSFCIYYFISCRYLASFY